MFSRPQVSRFVSDGRASPEERRVPGMGIGGSIPNWCYGHSKWEIIYGITLYINIIYIYISYIGEYKYILIYSECPWMTKMGLVQELYMKISIWLYGVYIHLHVLIWKTCKSNARTHPKNWFVIGYTQYFGWILRLLPSVFLFFVCCVIGLPAVWCIVTFTNCFASGVWFNHLRRWSHFPVWALPSHQFAV